MKKIFLVCLLTLVVESLFAQSSLQQYTPSVLLSQGQMEFKLFNNLYTQTKVRDANGTDVELGQRQSFLNHQFRFLYGVSNNQRLNVGFETNLTTAWYGGESSDLMFTSIGPTLKFVPIESKGNFSIQSTFLFPLNSDDLENPLFVNHNRYTWWTQFFYDYSINSKFNLFFEADLIYRFAVEDFQNDFFRVPLNLIASYFPTSKLTLYSNVQYAPAYGKLPGVEDIEFGRMRWFTQLGLGAKYLILNNLELELSYSNFILSKRDGAGSVYNFGIRFLR
ncbi:MAG: hypothetical protein R8N23_17840 [Reichenbachiella sp.]|uniref:hypothetical protein n=1 Tax=Reichenbachiella sp. TaxID=2184521 RepID=UPI002967222A|nr:hypothetical protein [Reichenbachiella sp.]MDW3211735.1 hypothetical protein [Reichenbachiella sp.]